MRHIFGACACALLLSACGTRTVPQSPAPPERRGDAMRVMATAYCQKGITKSGVHTRRGIVAADLRVLPLGTSLQILAPGQPYAGTYTVMDTGAGIKGREIDIFMPSCARAVQFGRKPVLIRILRRGRISGP